MAVPAVYDEYKRTKILKNIMLPYVMLCGVVRNKMETGLKVR